MRTLPLVLSGLLLTAGLAGCGSDSGSTSSDGGSGTTTLTVFAAASLKGPFTELGKDFEADHDGVKVTFSFAGSSDLVAQIQQGAGADVFASADQANMDKLGDDAQDPTLFATNTLEIAVPPDNPAGVSSLQDLTKAGIKLVVCAPEVPCGAAAAKVEDNAGLSFEPVSEEQSVTDVLNKVISGEADAGLVYVTDVEAAGDQVKGVEIPSSDNTVNDYPIATVADGKHADLAKEFVDLVTGDQGQQVLADAGFGKP